MPLFNARYSPYRYTGGGQIVGADGEQVAYLAGRMNDGNADVAGNVMAASVELYQSLHAMVQQGLRANWFCEPEDEEIVATANAALAKARGEI